jgi:hypothetical protein
VRRDPGTQLGDLARVGLDHSRRKSFGALSRCHAPHHHRLEIIKCEAYGRDPTKEFNVPTLEDVYRKFGEAAEAAQLLETELATMLLLFRATEDGLITEPDRARASDLLNTINRQTLGQLLKRLNGTTDSLASLELLLWKALDARNRLTHSFYRQHNFRRNNVFGMVDRRSDEIGAVLDGVGETDAASNGAGRDGIELKATDLSYARATGGATVGAHGVTGGNERMNRSPSSSRIRVLRPIRTARTLPAATSPHAVLRPMPVCLAQAGTLLARGGAALTSFCVMASSIKSMEFCQQPGSFAVIQRRPQSYSRPITKSVKEPGFRGI